MPLGQHLFVGFALFFFITDYVPRTFNGMIASMHNHLAQVSQANSQGQTPMAVATQNQQEAEQPGRSRWSDEGPLEFKYRVGVWGSHRVCKCR